MEPTTGKVKKLIEHWNEDLEHNMKEQEIKMEPTTGKLKNQIEHWKHREHYMEERKKINYLVNMYENNLNEYLSIGEHQNVDTNITTKETICKQKFYYLIHKLIQLRTQQKDGGIYNLEIFNLKIFKYWEKCLMNKISEYSDGDSVDMTNLIDSIINFIEFKEGIFNDFTVVNDKDIFVEMINGSTLDIDEIMDKVATEREMRDASYNTNDESQTHNDLRIKILALNKLTYPSPNELVKVMNESTPHTGGACLTSDNTNTNHNYKYKKHYNRTRKYVKTNCTKHSHRRHKKRYSLHNRNKRIHTRRRKNNEKYR